jgi:aquaporin Z
MITSVGIVSVFHIFLGLRIMRLGQRLGAEMFGTFWLVLGGCGSAVLAAGYPQLGIGFAGVSLAFGLTVLTMAYAIGHISGCHLNPAVSVGLTVAGRFPVRDLAPYIAAQVVGGVIGAYVLPAASPRTVTATSRRVITR